jgi:hypothetical protein
MILAPKLLTQFLIELSEDKDLHALYADKRTRENVIAESGLSEANKALLQAPNLTPAQIQAVLDEENAVTTNTNFMVSHVVARATQP